MEYYLKTFDDETIKVSEQDVKNLAGKTGLVWIKSINQAINVSAIKRILSQEQYNLELREKRFESDRGVLHDGTPVVRKFGQYYLESDPEARIDSRYFPEVAVDCVPTPQEFEDYKKLPPKERLTAILGTVDYAEREAFREPQSLKQLTEAWKKIDEIHSKKHHDEKN